MFPEWALGAGHAVLVLVLSQILQALPHGERWSHRLEYPNTSALKAARSPPNTNIEFSPGYSFSTFLFTSRLCCSSLGCVTAFFVPTPCRSLGCLRLFVLRYLGCFTWDINSIYHQHQQTSGHECLGVFWTHPPITIFSLGVFWLCVHGNKCGVFFLFIFVSFGGKSHSPAWQIGDSAGIFLRVLNSQLISVQSCSCLIQHYPLYSQPEER